MRVDQSGIRRGRPRSEEKYPQLAMDIRVIVEPRTQSDPAGASPSRLQISSTRWRSARGILALSQ